MRVFAYRLFTINQRFTTIQRLIHTSHTHRVAMSSLPRRKFILDCDTGTDDAQALMMALAQPDIEVVAVTSVMGNASLEDTTVNALRVLKYCGRTDIPVYRGCGRSMLGALTPTDGFHGADGLGSVFLDGVDPVDETLVRGEHAATALVRMVSEQPGQITLVATGPLSNIAMALHLDPKFGTKLKDIYVMGGNPEGRGNITPAAEFNIYCDPEAAYFVLGHLGRKITLAGVEMCERHAFSWDWYDNFTSDETRTGALIGKFERYMVERCKKRGAAEYFMVWDQVAMAIAINNQVATETKDVHAVVELTGQSSRGQVIVDWNNKLGKEPNVRLVLGVDKSLFGKLMNSIIASS